LLSAAETATENSTGGRAMAQDAVHILFEGSKYFGNTKTLFHIALVEHTSHDVIEIVSYDKRHSVEAPSLYLSYSALLIRINDNAVSQRVQDLREEAEERDMVADENKILKIAIGETMFDFLSSRLFASAAGANKAKLEFKLLQKDLISLPGQNPLRSKPDDLEPFSYDSGLIRYADTMAPSSDHFVYPLLLFHYLQRWQGSELQTEMVHSEHAGQGRQKQKSPAARGESPERVLSPDH
jgi:hypothetical protein